MDDDSDQESGDVIAARAATRLAKHVEKALSPIDLTVSQYRVLAILAEESAAAGRLADRLAVRPPTVTTVIDGLVARRLVDRQADPDDRRRQVLALTPLGREALALGDGAIATRLRQLARRLDTREASRAMAGLVDWHEAMERAGDERGARAPS